MLVFFSMLGSVYDTNTIRYPFHLRPKNKQAFQYIRMAGDLVRDLELDQESPELVNTPDASISDQQLDKVRTYLAWYYSVSAYVHISHDLTATNTPRFVTAWKQMQHLAAPFTAWTATCCGILERNAEVEGDLILTTLVHVSSDIHAANDAIYGKDGGQNQLILLGLEARHRNLRQKMLPHVSRSSTYPGSWDTALLAHMYSIHQNRRPVLRPLLQRRLAPPRPPRKTVISRLRIHINHQAASLRRDSERAPRLRPVTRPVSVRIIQQQRLDEVHPQHHNLHPYFVFAA